MKTINIPSLKKINRAVFLLGLFKIPMVFFTRLRVTEFSENEIAVKIPLRRRTKNHLGSMYFGALSVGADVSGGLLTWFYAQNSGQKVPLVFKKFEARFLKRPTGDVTFRNKQGAKAKLLIEKAIETGERCEETFLITAHVDENGNDVRVAEFDLTISVKHKP